MCQAETIVGGIDTKKVKLAVKRGEIDWFGAFGGASRIRTRQCV